MRNDLISTWSCEIGVVPINMVPEGGDAPLRNVVTECWDRMFPGIPSSISSGWGPVSDHLPYHPLPSEANLGCATSEELMRELIARFSVNYPNDASSMIMTNRAIQLAEMLGGLSNYEKEYRTVDH